MEDDVVGVICVPFLFVAAVLLGLVLRWWSDHKNKDLTNSPQSEV